MIDAAGHITAEQVGQAIGRPVAMVRRRDWDYHSSHAMQELDVEFADGSRCDVMFKNLSPSAQLPDARRTRPEFLYLPRREIDVYRDVLATAELDTPRYLGS